MQQPDRGVRLAECNLGLAAKCVRHGVSLEMRDPGGGLARWDPWEEARQAIRRRVLRGLRLRRNSIDAT
jgi:hypothetical protein